ncbi:MAG: hypothetical protein ACYCZB_06015 [Acidiphilium sp.]
MIRMGLLCLLLAGCAAPKPATVTRIELVRPEIPTALLSCPEAPVVPMASRQSQVAAYVAELWQAHAVCYDHLAAVGRTLGAEPVTR